jgi:curli biogenesis system outer membrane secretion channel CsgG
MLVTRTRTRWRRRRIIRRSAMAIWLVLLCSNACLQTSAQTNPQKKRVAVLDFEDDTGGSINASGAFGADAGAASKGISALIIAKLVSGGKYTIVDRSALKKILDEQNNSDTPDTDPAAIAARIGQILGLDAMIVGRITRFGPEAAQKEGGGHSGVSTRKSKAYVEITSRVLGMSSGEVLAVFTASGESAHTGDVIRITVRGRDADRKQSKLSQEMLSSEFINSLLGEASANAVEKIATQINDFAEKIPTLRLALDGLVAEVAENSITLNLGKKSGLKVGDKLAIVREIRPVADQTTAASLPPVVEHLGEATVTEVTDDYATATFSGSGQVRVGDRVKSADIALKPSN